MLQISYSGGFRGLGDAKTDAITLQLAANRYATAVGKAPLITDGVIGSLTLAMVRAALQYLVTKNVGAATAQALLTKVTTTAAVTASAVGLSTFLNDSMDSLKIAAIEAQKLITSAVGTQFMPNMLTKPTAQPAQPPLPQTQPLVPSASSQQVVTTLPPTMMLPATAIVGLSPSAKKALMIVGGVVVGLLVLKRLL